MAKIDCHGVLAWRVALASHSRCVCVCVCAHAGAGVCVGVCVLEQLSWVLSTLPKAGLSVWEDAISSTRHSRETTDSSKEFNTLQIEPAEISLGRLYLVGSS